jgi:putative transposase
MPRRPPADWPAFVNEPHDLEELAALRDAVNRGSPFGDDDRRDYTVRDLGLKSSLRPRRRPKKATVEQEGAY